MLLTRHDKYNVKNRKTNLYACDNYHEYPYKKLCTKYSGDELKRKIREKMYLKGLEYEEN